MLMLDLGKLEYYLFLFVCSVYLCVQSIILNFQQSMCNQCRYDLLLLKCVFSKLSDLPQFALMGKALETFTSESFFCKQFCRPTSLHWQLFGSAALIFGGSMGNVCLKVN